MKVGFIMLSWLIVIGGLVFILFQIFLSSGGKTKFKSDLPKTDIVVKRKKVGLIICFSILSVLALALLIVVLISFL